MWQIKKSFEHYFAGIEGENGENLWNDQALSGIPETLLLIRASHDAVYLN